MNCDLRGSYNKPFVVGNEPATTTGTLSIVGAQAFHRGEQEGGD